MKKIISSIVFTTLMLTSASTFAVDVDLGSLDNIETTDTTIESTNTITAEDIQLSDMQVIFSDSTDIPADGKETSILVKVSDDKGNSLADDKVKLEVELAENEDNSKGTIGEIKYDEELEAFSIAYISGKTPGKVFLTLKAFLKDNTSSAIEQGEEFTLIAPTIIEENTTKENNEDVLSAENENTTPTNIQENIIETNNTDNKTENVEVGANIVSNKVMDENRLKIEFDREIFLPEEPLSLVTIEKVSDGSKIKIANITLSSDKRSMIILTSDNIGKEQYHLSINEIIDGETKKKINVVNGELTVTGFNEILLFLLSLLIASGFFYIKRKKA